MIKKMTKTKNIFIDKNLENKEKLGLRSKVNYKKHMSYRLPLKDIKEIKKLSYLASVYLDKRYSQGEIISLGIALIKDGGIEEILEKYGRI